MGFVKLTVLLFQWYTLPHPSAFFAPPLAPFGLARAPPARLAPDPAPWAQADLVADWLNSDQQENLSNAEGMVLPLVQAFLRPLRPAARGPTAFGLPTG